MVDNFQKRCFGNSDEDIKISMEESSITDKELTEIIKSVNDWYKKQPHLPNDPFDNNVMLRFCLLNKYSIERIKEKLENYLVSRTILPELFTDRNPFENKILEHLKNIPCFYIPKLTDEYYRIIITQFNNGDPSLYDPLLFLKSAFMISDLRLRYETSLGDLYVCDMKHVKLGHVLKITPSLIKKCIFVALSCYGFRIKALYFINVPTYAHSVINLFKSFLKKKIADRVRICSSLDELHQFIKPEYLPIELGGIKKSSNDFMGDIIKEMQTENWVKWYKESAEIKSDESKRIEKSEDKVGDLLGITGSFRKLDID